MPEWLIEKINRFDTKYKIKNFFEITFSIISKLQVKSRKIVRQNATISQSNIIRATSLVLYKKAVENFICLPIHSSWVTFKIFHIAYFIRYARREPSYSFLLSFLFFPLVSNFSSLALAFPRKVKHGNRCCRRCCQCYSRHS